MLVREALEHLRARVGATRIIDPREEQYSWKEDKHSLALMDHLAKEIPAVSALLNVVRLDCKDSDTAANQAAIIVGALIAALREATEP